MTDYASQDLAKAFVESSERHFLALESAYRLERRLDAEVLGAGGLQQVRPEDIGNGLFVITLALSGASFSVFVSYGDREYDLNCRIHCKNHDGAYALWEWLDVLGTRGLIEDVGGWVLTVPRIESVLSQFEQALEQLAPVVASPSPALERQLEQQRLERILLGSQRFAEDEHRRLASRAAEAFHRHDYPAVVEALLAVGVELTPSEKAKLAYARKRI